MFARCVESFSVSVEAFSNPVGNFSTDIEPISVRVERSQMVVEMFPTRVDLFGNPVHAPRAPRLRAFRFTLSTFHCQLSTVSVWIAVELSFFDTDGVIASRWPLL